MSNPVILSLKVSIAEEVLQKYEEEAKKRRCTLELLVKERLEKFVDATAIKPLFFGDESRRELETLLGKNFSSADDVISSVRRSLTMKLNEIPVTLEPRVLTRLQSRCFGQTFDKFLTETVNRELADFCMS